MRNSVQHPPLELPATAFKASQGASLIATIVHTCPANAVSFVLHARFSVLFSSIIPLRCWTCTLDDFCRSLGVVDIFVGI